jgi:hypothetical protein
MLFPATALSPGDAGFARVMESLEQREYHASESRGRLQAPNRAHNLRSYFEATGLRVHDRTAPGDPELLSLALAGVGRGETLRAVEPGEVISQGARVEIRRAGLVEWYENSAAGLEQGFTLAERPAGEGTLLLEMTLSGATASLHGDAVILSTPPARRLRYDKLVAFDASGRELAARLSVPASDRVRIEVEDLGAAYPLLIDPQLTDTANARLESDLVDAKLGYSVAAAGDVNGDGYGDVIVGAPGYDTGQPFAGAAFVFLGSASGIGDGSPATASAGLESDQSESQFGWRVSGAGDVNGDGYDDVIVGAWGYDGEGAAFVFHGSADGVSDGSPASADARIEANQASAFLGWSVARAGDVNADGYGDVIVGAWYYEVGELHPGCHCLVYPHPDEGAAFVFHGSASGIGDRDPTTADTVLRANRDGSIFGRSVAGAGDVNGDGYDDVIVGTPYWEVAGENQGAVFVFEGSASGIADADPAGAAAFIESDATGQASLFGSSVAGAGDVNGDGYDDVVVGAPMYTTTSSFMPGAVFVFHGSAGGVAAVPPAAAASVLQSGDGPSLGIEVRGAGDVDGDGYDDVIVGAGNDLGGDLFGQGAFVFLGGASGIPNDAPRSAFGPAYYDSSFGASAAGAGDVDGDGRADLIIGDPGDYPASGAAFVFLGSADADGDRVIDGADNCATANPTQYDADGDGFGNRCDADFDDSGVSAAADFFTFRQCFGQSVPTGGPPQDLACLESDMDGDGVVDGADFVLFRAEFGTPPGP